MIERLRVVKVGGSLYDLPDLAARLQALLGSSRTLIVPGGGPIVDAIRSLDQVHELGEETCHWLALRALSLNAQFLARLVPAAVILPRLPSASEAGNCYVLDPSPFFQEDDRRPGHLPHTWDVASDSLAVRIAIRAAATELLLLKSVSYQATGDWAAAARAGVVDRFFPEAIGQAPALEVRIVNLRSGEYTPVG
jgi:aspartokinase-like uncharacterized kinase